ncbi:MAG: DUF6655 family protein [Planctomycetaceae bacterium]
MSAHHHHAMLLCLLLVAAGCGTTQQRLGTEQLLLSDSVDHSVDQIDCSALSGRKVYLDTTYINLVKGIAFVNYDYNISALRHKLTVSGCLVQENKTDAEYIVEARVGALGTDSLEVTYGLPASNALGQAASLMTSVPAAPTIPEISVGKRNAALSTSKIVMYAYHRESGTPVWQSGSSISKTDAKDTWVLGAGPLQRGSIYNGATFAGIKLKGPFFSKKKDPPSRTRRTTIADAHQFVHPAVLEQQLADARLDAEQKLAEAKRKEEQAIADAQSQDKPPTIVPASHEEPAAAETPPQEAAVEKPKE